MRRRTLEVRRESPDDQTVVYTLTGDLFGSSQGYAFQEEVREKIAGGARKIVVDLAAVRRIDSAGVGILVAMMFSASQAGGGLVAAALPPQVESVLGITMLLEHIGRADSVEEARVKLDGMIKSETVNP